MGGLGQKGRFPVEGILDRMSERSSSPAQFALPDNSSTSPYPSLQRRGMIRKSPLTPALSLKGRGSCGGGITNE